MIRAARRRHLVLVPLLMLVVVALAGAAHRAGERAWEPLRSKGPADFRALVAEREREPVRVPDPLLYLVPAGTAAVGGALPDRAVLLGRWDGDDAPLPPAPGGREGVRIVYSLARQQVARILDGTAPDGAAPNGGATATEDG